MTEVLIYRNQSIDLLYKSVDWFLDDRDLRHERVNKQSRIQDPLKYLCRNVSLHKKWSFP